MYPEQILIYPPDLFRQVFDRDLGVCCERSAFGDVAWLNHHFYVMAKSALKKLLVPVDFDLSPLYAEKMPD